MLHNFIALVITVRWATTHSTSETHIQLVEQHYSYYLKTTIQLFGTGAVKTTNNHAMQHLAECLRSFGPVHTWWAFPFERFNGMIQKTRSNRHLGKYMYMVLTRVLSAPLTMLCRWTSRALIYEVIL
jgi:hypothetical protein